MALTEMADFSSIEFTNTFGTEFSKHEALWKYQGADNVQLGKIRIYIAHITMARNLGLPLEKVIELCNDFPTICLDLIKQTSSKKLNTSWKQVPKWLNLMVKSHFLRNMKPNARMAPDPEILIRELFYSVDKAHDGNYMKRGLKLSGPAIVDHFAQKFKVKVDEVLPLWQAIYKMCFYKLKALMHSSNRKEDIPKSLSLVPYEWKVIDLVILHNHTFKLVHLSDRITVHKQCSLILLYKLMVAARNVYDEFRVQIDQNDDTVVGTADTEPGIKDKINSIGNGVKGATSKEKPNNKIKVVIPASGVAGSSTKHQTEASEPSDTANERNWFENIEGQKVVWSLVYTSFIKHGRIGSLIYLQRRWLELLHLARTAIMDVWKSPYTDTNLHPLFPLLVRRFPEIITQFLPSWKQIVDERLVIFESDIEDLMKKNIQKEKLIIDINGDITDMELVKEFYNNELNRIITESYKGEDFTSTLEKIDPTKARMTILFNDSDEEIKEPEVPKTSEIIDENGVCTEDVGLLDRDTSGEYEPMDVETNNVMESQNDLKEIRSIEIDDVLVDEGVSHSEDDGDLSLPSQSLLSDEKLSKECRVVLTPIEYLSPWNSFSKNGSIRLKKFSVKKFTKPVLVDSKQLQKCRRYVQDDNNGTQLCSDTQRQTNNSLSSCCFSAELRKLLTEKQESNNTTASETPTVTSMMDTIIENMRSDENYPPMTTVQKPPISGPVNDSICNDLTSSNHSLSSNTKSTDHIDSESMPNSMPTLNDYLISKNKSSESTFPRLDEILDITPVRCRGTIFFETREMRVPKVGDLRKVVANVAATCRTLQYKDDRQVVMQFMKLRGNKIIKHSREVKKEIMKVMNILPQLKSAVKKSRRTRKKEDILNKREQLTDKTTKNEASGSSMEINDDGKRKLIIDEIYKGGNNDRSRPIKTQVKNKGNATKATKKQEDSKKNKQNRKKKRVSKTSAEEKVENEDKPIQDEYLEWQRQKTMSLKYFTLPSGTIKDSAQRQKKKDKKGKRTNVSKTTPNTTNTGVDRPHSGDVVLTSDSNGDVQVPGVVPPVGKQDRPTQTETNIKNDNIKSYQNTLEPFYIVANNGELNGYGIPLPPSVCNKMMLEIHPPVLPMQPPTAADVTQPTSLVSNTDDS